MDYRDERFKIQTIVKPLNFSFILSGFRKQMEVYVTKKISFTF
jgi:hypothetical protein